MTISWRDWEALISIGWMRDSLEIDSGMQDLKRWDRDKILKVVEWQNEAKTSGRMRDLKSLFWTLQ